MIAGGKDSFMANRSYLLAVEDRSVTLPEDPGREVIAEGIDEIPVFWASLFGPEDRQLDSYEGEGDDIQVPNYCVALPAARQRLVALRGPIGQLLDERSRVIWAQWVDHLMGVRAAYLKTSAAEVWDLDPDGYDAYWITLLRPFAEPDATHLGAAVEANGLSFEDGAVIWEDDEETICKLAGAAHIGEVPWSD